MLTNYKCPRCHKSEGILAKEASYSLFFCGTEACMDDDCRASKIKRNEDSLTKTQQELSAHEQKIKENKIKAFGSLYQTASLSKSRLSSSELNQIKHWLDKKKDFFVFSGSPGCGKTYHCAAVYFWLLEKNNKILYLRTRDLYYLLHRAIEEKRSKGDVLAQFKDQYILILDDLGSSQNTEWQKEVMLDLIDYRYEFRKPTMITTNCYYDQLAQDMGERIASRVYNTHNLIISDWKSNYRNAKEGF